MHHRAGLHRADLLAAFLKYLDAMEQDKAMEAELEGREYTFILDEPYSWAVPMGAEGKLDHHKAHRR